MSWVRSSVTARAVQVLLALVLGIAASSWAAKALSDETPFDVGLAYLAGETAWATGHPEDLATWISTPFLGMVMAVVSQAVELPTAVKALTLVNLGLALSLIAVVWHRLRRELPLFLWWATLAGAVLFAPLVSSIWWKQFNLVAFTLAVSGFAAIRAGRGVAGAALTALSLCVKPLVVLLPFALLLRRETRRSALWTFAWIAVLLLASQAFLAIRAGSMSALSPVSTIEAFSERTKPQNVWACHTENFAPGSLLCRVAGAQYWNYERLLVVGLVLLFAALAYDSLRGRAGTSWAFFAFASLLSPMVSPIAWSHYQLLLAPMFLVLIWEFVRHGARPSLWASLAASFALTEVVWRPYGTLPGTVIEFFTGRVETLEAIFAVMAVAQFAQYLLFFTAVVWFAARLAAAPVREDA